MSEVAGGASPGERQKGPEEEAGPSEHLREDTGAPGGSPSVADQEAHLREDAGLLGEELEEQQEGADKGLIDKVKDKLTGDR